jgi:hypothetical protein
MKTTHLFLGAAMVVTLAACGDDNVPPAPPPITPASEPAPVSEAPVPVPEIDSALRMDGIGDVHIGMSRADIEGVLSTTLDAPPPFEGATCLYATTDALPGLRLMLEDGALARIDVEGAGVRTVEGVGIGTAEADVVSVYGPRATVMPHKYEPTWNYVEVVETNPREPALMYVFESDGANIVGWRAGRAPQVQYVEGCS